MRVLYHFRTRGTGPEGVHIAGMVGGFRRIGHEVELLSPTGVDPCATAGDDPFAGSGGQGGGLWQKVAANVPQALFEAMELGYNAWAAPRLLKRALRNPPDFIYERHAFFNVAGALASILSGVPLVLEVNELPGHSRVRGQLLSALAGALDRLNFRAADAVLTVSPFLQREVQRRTSRREKVYVVPNAVDEAKFGSAVDHAGARKKLGVADRPTVGFVGWFVPWHRLDLLVAAAAGLAERIPDLALVLVGDGPLRGALEQQARELGRPDLLVMPGPVPHTQVAEAIDAFDVAVIPHSNEYRSPIKAFEYLSRGRAVVAVDTEPMREVVRHRETGWLFEPEDQDGMARGLEAFLQDRELRDRVGASGRELVLGSYTWADHARRVAKMVG